MATDITDVMNQGFRAASLPMRIQDYYEGSDAARVALELLGQARDELIRFKDWSFSRRVAALTLLKGPPPPGGFNFAQPWSNIYAYPGFLYSYSYPVDCLDVRAIYPPPGLMPDLDPLPANWRIDDDQLPNVVNGVATGPEAKVILCNCTNAMISYRARVTNCSLWDVGFTAALVASLGKKFAEAFGADANSVREEGTEALGIAQTAGMVRG
jgi:hypothetical protein